MGGAEGRRVGDREGEREGGREGGGGARAKPQHPHNRR